MNLLFIVFLSLHTAQYKFEFGVTHVGNIGEGNEEITRYIMCCANQGGDDESIMNEMDGIAMNEVTPPPPAKTTATAAQMSMKE